MLLPKFAFHQPAGVAEALEIMAQYGERAAIIAGGTDLLVNMKHGKLAPAQLIGLERLDDLAGLRAEGDALVVGPRLTASALAVSAELSGAAKVLALGAGAVGSPQVRNRATV
ncbi:MAG: FAD binding domain-containing protein, partial [Desulfarculaceae bacterium]|nr:FAD binding domain-containing protein [Desulfarculaceae bacterium]